MLVLYKLNPGTNEPIFKLGDFGIARPIPNSGQLATMNSGTPGYIAPEVWRGEPYNQQADMFSLGAVMNKFRTPAYSKWRTLMRELARDEYLAQQPRPFAFEVRVRALNAKNSCED